MDLAAQNSIDHFNRHNEVGVHRLRLRSGAPCMSKSEEDKSRGAPFMSAPFMSMEPGCSRATLDWSGVRQG